MFVDPMKAVLVAEPFDSAEWIFEAKFDGYRGLAYKTPNGSLVLKSRNNKELNHAFPEVIQALANQAVSTFILDGEICAIKKGLSNFQALQNKLNNFEDAEIKYYVFDLLYIDGYDITGLPLIIRKAILQNMFQFNNTFVYSDHLVQNGIKYFKHACKLEWEGIIAKKADSKYVHARSNDWQKFKCVHEQEFIIVGYTDPGGARSDFGALLLGYYDDQMNLVYSGKVGTGFNQANLQMLGEKLRMLETKKPAIKNFALPEGTIHWIKPKLVCEVKFIEWTQDGYLRHASFLGLRDDKKAQEVIKEVPKKYKY